eukprot:UN29587
MEYYFSLTTSIIQIFIVNPLYYALNFVSVILIVLPSSFLVLILGYSKVEETSERIAQGAAKLAKESLWSRVKRVLLLFVISCLLNVFLIGYPILFLYYINNNQTTYIVIYIALIIIFQICGAYRCGVSYHKKYFAVQENVEEP